MGHRTGHNRLFAHVSVKPKIGQSETCSTDTAAVTSEHLLQHCPLQDGPRRAALSEEAVLREKLYGDLAELKRTAVFVKVTGVDV